MRVTTDIAVREYSLPDIKGIANHFAESGFFKDAADVSKAFVKILAGQELGIGPMQSMSGFHVIQGKTAMSATLVGALIKRSGRYDYRVQVLDDQSCNLVFFENGEEVGQSSFSMSEAQTAGLTSNPTWKKFPRNMLLSRALTNGARWFCPDVFGGAVYTPDELGAQVDGETGEIIDAQILPDAAPIPATPRAADEPTGAAASSEEPEAESGAASEEDAREITGAERNAFFAKAKAKGLNGDDLKSMVKLVTGRDSTRGITVVELHALDEALEGWGDAVDVEATEEATD